MTDERLLTAAMDNVDAQTLGQICRKAAADPSAGDSIDRGLILRQLLEDGGYGIVKLPAQVDTHRMAETPKEVRGEA